MKSLLTLMVVAFGLVATPAGAATALNFALHRLASAPNTSFVAFSDDERLIACWTTYDQQEIYLRVYSLRQMDVNSPVPPPPKPGALPNLEPPPMIELSVVYSLVLPKHGATNPTSYVGAFSPDNNKLYIVHAVDRKTSVLVVDLATKKVIEAPITGAIGQVFGGYYEQVSRVTMTNASTLRILSRAGYWGSEREINLDTLVLSEPKQIFGGMYAPKFPGLTDRWEIGTKRNIGVHLVHGDVGRGEAQGGWNYSFDAQGEFPWCVGQIGPDAYVFDGTFRRHLDALANTSYIVMSKKGGYIAAVSRRVVDFSFPGAAAVPFLDVYKVGDHAPMPRGIAPFASEDADWPEFFKGVSALPKGALFAEIYAAKKNPITGKSIGVELGRLKGVVAIEAGADGKIHSKLVEYRAAIEEGDVMMNFWSPTERLGKWERYSYYIGKTAEGADAINTAPIAR